MANGCAGKEWPADPEPPPDVRSDVLFGFSFTGNGRDIVWSADTAILRPLSSSLPSAPRYEIIAWRWDEAGSGKVGERIEVLLRGTAIGSYDMRIFTDSTYAEFVTDFDPTGLFDPELHKSSEGTLSITESTSHYLIGTITYSGTASFSGTPFLIDDGSFKVYYD